MLPACSSLAAQTLPDGPNVAALTLRPPLALPSRPCRPALAGLPRPRLPAGLLRAGLLGAGLLGAGLLGAGLLGAGLLSARTLGAALTRGVLQFVTEFLDFGPILR